MKQDNVLEEQILTGQAEINSRIQKNLAESLNQTESARLTAKKANWYEAVLILGFAAALLAAGKYLL